MSPANSVCEFIVCWLLLLGVEVVYWGEGKWVEVRLYCRLLTEEAESRPGWSDPQEEFVS